MHIAMQLQVTLEEKMSCVNEWKDTASLPLTFIDAVLTLENK